MTIDGDKLRPLLGHFVTGCTVVTMNSEPPHGLTANAFSSLSLDPPLVLVCVDHDTESHDLLGGGRADGFCVNLLAKDQQDLAEHFAGMSEAETPPFERPAATTAGTGAVAFEDGLAYLDCSVHDTHEAGDHTIYIGRVEGADTCRTDAEPLVFYKGGWGTVDMDES